MLILVISVFWCTVILGADIIGTVILGADIIVLLSPLENGSRYTLYLLGNVEN